MRIHVSLVLRAAFVKQISALFSSHCAFSIFRFCYNQKNIGPLNLIIHLWETVYTLRLLRKGKFFSCTWSTGYTWRKWPLDPFRCSENKTCLTLSYPHSYEQHYCSQIYAAYIYIIYMSVCVYIMYLTDLQKQGFFWVAWGRAVENKVFFNLKVIRLGSVKVCVWVQTSIQ